MILEIDFSLIHFQFQANTLQRGAASPNPVTQLATKHEPEEAMSAQQMTDLRLFSVEANSTPHYQACINEPSERPTCLS